MQDGRPRQINIKHCYISPRLCRPLNQTFKHQKFLWYSISTRRLFVNSIQCRAKPNSWAGTSADISKAVAIRAQDWLNVTGVTFAEMACGKEMAAFLQLRSCALKVPTYQSCCLERGKEFGAKTTHNTVRIGAPFTQWIYFFGHSKHLRRDIKMSAILQRTQSSGITR